MQPVRGGGDSRSHQHTEDHMRRTKRIAKTARAALELSNAS